MTNWRGTITTDYRATQTASSTTGATDNTTAPTISYDSRTATTITLNRGNLGGTYTPAATTIVVGGTTYYKGSNGIYSTTAPSATLNPTYTWSVTSGNASITQAGVVTPNNNITNNITVRLTTTNANPALTKTTDYTINVSSTAEATTYSGGLNAVTPANNSITYNANTGITLDSPARKKNTTAAYQTYTASGNTFYRVNNNFQPAAPTATSTDVAVTSYSWALSGTGATNAQLASATGTTNTLTYKTASPSDVATTVTVTANYAEGGNISKNANVTLKAYVANPTAIAADDIKLRVGETLTLNPTLSCAIPGYTNIYRSLSYSSANTGIATVNATTGLVTGVAKGTTTITITAALQGGGSITKKINVNVAELAVAPTITFSNATGELTMSSSTPGAEIHYTLTGSDPTSGSATYNDASKPVLTQGATVKAITVADGYLNSNVTTLVVEQVATPTVTVDGTSVKFACSTAGVTYYYTTDGSDPTLSSTNTTSTTLTTIPSGSTLKVMAVKSGLVNSEVASKYIELSLATPTITISDGKVTMTSPDGATIHYTTDGSTPTASSPTYSAPLTATNGVTYKAIAIKAGFADSEVAEEKYMIASGVSGGTVTINDYEDHNWTYYAGVDPEVDGGNYNTNYKGKLYSPNPRNVKITYYGKGRVAKTDDVNGEYVDISNDNNYTVKVGINEPENTFVYYKTLERDNNSRYPYTTIPNPFSVRPVYGTNATTKWRGFYRWRIKTLTDGSIYAASTGGTALAVGSYLEPDKEYYFQPSDYNNDNYTINGTSMKVEVEAVWVRAYVNTANSNTNFVSKANGGWERNFVVYRSDTGNTATGFADYPVTYTALYPNGTTNGTTTATAIPDVSVATNMALDGDVKIENIRMNGGATLSANWNSLWVVRNTIGSGTNNVSAQRLTGIDNTTTKDSPQYTLRIESGKYNYFDVIKGHNTDGGTGNTNYSISGTTTNARAFVGCDYDRAKNDNSLLNVVNQLQMGCGGSFTNSANCANEHTMDMFIKSGTIGSKYWIENTNTATQLQGGMGRGCYMGSSSTATNTGRRNVTVEGGDICAIGGGYEGANNRNYLVFNLRIMGGTVHGNIYGGASQSPAYGSRRFVFTGGRIMGWVAPGCNGTSSDGGQTNGESFAYIGGNTRVDSGTNTKKLGYACGGNVYAAGAGREGTSTCGEMTYGTNLVIADDCYIQRGAYGGGNYGYANVHTNIYITGGTNAGQTDTQAGNAKGGVFGGSNQQNGPEIKIWMTGGKMLGGVYGGCNTKGNITGNVTMQINGGQVGTNASNTANIHGGGYGDGTSVPNNVEITLGKEGQTTNGVKVYGNVYGGAALGTTGGNTKHTYVKVYRGSVTGDVFGGGMGENGSDTKGVVTGTIAVDVYGTDPAPDADTYALHGVYGGGDLAPYAGTPTVKVHNCDNSIEYVYGGGNATSVAGTDVTIYGGDKIGNVFGGGNGQVKAANVNGATNVKIYGGTIGDVYGGSNTNGTIGGKISVNVNAQAEPDHSACPIDIDNVYGGGNKAASNVGNITIGCAEHIGAVYGGANQANITGDITLNINSGHIDNVFGGNNNSGNISGSITVNVDDKGKTCGMSVGNVYGGGNKAAYGHGTNYPEVNIINADITGSVFGGGLGSTAVVTGNPRVNISDWNADHHVVIGGNVFGGGDAAEVVGTPVVVVNDCGTVIGNKDGDIWTGGDIFGGGNAAAVTGTNLTVWGGTMHRVFAGGNGTSAPANVGNGGTNAHIFGGTIGEVYGGSNSQGTITGAINVEVNEKKSTATGASLCEVNIDDLYGGGNMAASSAGNISISKCKHIGRVFGGANQANVSGDINLSITDGHIDNVFGGNNNSGQVSGDITVNVNWADGVNADNAKVGNVYGGGNIASIDNGTPRTVTVNIPNATISGSVFGGGKGKDAVIVGSTKVNIGAWSNTTSAIVNGDVFGGGDLAAVEGDCSITIRDCNTLITGDLYGGGNAAPVYSTNTTMWGGLVAGNVFGGGNGADPSKNSNGAQVGYKRDDSTAGTGEGKATTNIFGGTVGTWSGDGNTVCANGTGGVFGGSNTNGNIRGGIALTLDQQTCTETGAEKCTLKLREIYGAGNEAAYAGTGINFDLGCVDYLEEIYGGAKAADLNADAKLTIRSGHFKNVFGGNNERGKLNGKIVVNIDETGCNPIIIENLYGGGNLAAYSVYGYENDLNADKSVKVKTSGSKLYEDPQVNIISCTRIDNVFGGGYGTPAVMVGNPTVTVNQIKGRPNGVESATLGVIGTIYGGGNAAKVIGDTNVKVGTAETKVKHISGDDQTTEYDAGANITGNVYGGGNQADVTGKTNVTIGK